MTKILARVTAKGQTTIPKKVRDELGVAPGDSILFEIRGRRVSVRRVEPLDAGFLKLATESFADWNSPEDDESFRGL